MLSLQRVAKSITNSRIIFNSTSLFKSLSTKNGDDQWNDAWESAWLPEDLSPTTQAPWETDVNFSSPAESPNLAFPSDVDAETKAFVEDMNENWNQRRRAPRKKQQELDKERKGEDGSSLYSLENLKKDYRLKKQRVHAGLWVKEIEKMEEAKLGDSGVGASDDIERLLDSCSDFPDWCCEFSCRICLRRVWKYQGYRVCIWAKRK